MIKPIWSATDTDVLRRDLLMNYDKFAVPLVENVTTTVNVGLAIAHLQLDEIKSVLTVHGWMTMVGSGSVWANPKAMPIMITK